MPPCPLAVVIPTYNGASYIQEALESVFAQSVAPAEIVVVDDASTDATVAIVARIARTAPLPLRLMRNTRNSGGPARPLNRGVRQSHGEWVALLDQDDRMNPTKVKTVVDLIRRYPDCGLAFGQYSSFDENGARPINSYACFPDHVACLSPRKVFDTLLTPGYCLGGAGGTAVSKRAWESVGGFNCRFRIAWDYDFALRLLLTGWSFAYAPTLFYAHRLHGKNLNDTEGGQLAYCEARRVLLSCLHHPALTAQARRAVLDKLAPDLLQLGYWERTLGFYTHAVRAYLVAMRLRLGLGAALRGLCRVALQALIWPSGSVKGNEGRNPADLHPMPSFAWRR